jgi:ferric-chelate reductase
MISMLNILEKLSYCLLVGIAEILLECEGSNVGVLVCGPKKMRHEVAKICSSGLAENLHLDSISFNW